MLLLLTATLAPRADATSDLTVGETRRADAIAWAASSNVSCSQRAAGRWMQCGDMDLHFDGEGTLWKMQRRRDHRSPAQAAESFRFASSTAEERMGPPDDWFGDAQPKTHRRAVRSYQRGDVRASIVVSNHGERVEVIETYTTRS